MTNVRSVFHWVVCNSVQFYSALWTCIQLDRNIDAIPLKTTSRWMITKGNQFSLAISRKQTRPRGKSWIFFRRNISASFFFRDKYFDLLSSEIRLENAQIVTQRERERAQCKWCLKSHRQWNWSSIILHPDQLIFGFKANSNHEQKFRHIRHVPSAEGAYRMEIPKEFPFSLTFANRRAQFLVNDRAALGVIVA